MPNIQKHPTSKNVPNTQTRNPVKNIQTKRTIHTLEFVELSNPDMGQTIVELTPSYQFVQDVAETMNWPQNLNRTPC